MNKLNVPDGMPALRDEWLRFGVERAWIFGSRARQVNNTGSDWDFLVQFAEPPKFDTFMGLKTRLEALLNGSVDVLSRSACSPRVLSAIENDLIDVT